MTTTFKASMHLKDGFYVNSAMVTLDEFTALVEDGGVGRVAVYMKGTKKPVVYQLARNSIRFCLSIVPTATVRFVSYEVTR